jgi:hypothetical protein
MPKTARALFVVAWVVSMLAGSGSRAEAQVSLDPLAPPLLLGVSGNSFTINGAPRFLLCVSYFAGIRASAATISSDFEALADKGFNCVRVWANWYYEGLTPSDYKNYLVMNKWGDLNATNMNRLKSLISEAFNNGLVVDVTFTRDTIARIEPNGVPQCMGFDDYRVGVADVAAQLTAFDNVFFDLQNESNHYASKGCPRACAGCINLPNCENANGNCGKWYLSPPEAALVANSVRARDPQRLLAVSSVSSFALGEYVRAADLEIAARHCCNTPTWVTEVGPAVGATRSAVGQGIPIHFQEPNRCPGYGSGSVDCTKTGSANQHVNAAVNAKNAGAAGWTLHNPGSFRLHAATLMAQLNTPSEIDAVDRLADVLDVDPPAPPPPPPTLVSPPHGATTTTTPTFVWNAVVADPPVNNYKLQIRRSSDNVKVFGAFVGNVTTHTLAAGKLSPGVTYKWRVKAFSPSGKSGWSPYRTFTTQ